MKEQLYNMLLSDISRAIIVEIEENESNRIDSLRADIRKILNSRLNHFCTVEEEMSFEMPSYLAVKDCNDKEQWRLLEFDSMDELKFAMEDEETLLYEILKQCEYKILQEITGAYIIMRDDSKK